MAKSVSPVINLFGNSNLLETPEVVEVPKEHLSILQPLDLSAYKLSPGASAAGVGVDKLFSSMQSQFEAQTAQSQAYLDAQRKQIEANMEAVLRMQEERRKAEEEARKKAEKEAEEARKKAEEAKKELEKSIDEDPSAIIRPDLDAVLNSEVYKNAGDKQKRDLLAEAAKQYETKITAQGLDSKYVKKLVDAFKINGERNVVEYINKSEKDKWDIVNDLIVPVKGAIDRSRASMHTKDARTIDQAIADIKAGKEVSGWAVDEILDRDPSLRKYIDVTSGFYSGITQGVGSKFKLKPGVASEFATAANKTWNTAIDKAVALDKNAQEIDASRSANAQRHWKNYDYEAAKIDNAEKAGQISSFDSFLAHGKLFLSNPTVPLDKAAPSLIKAVGETVILDRTANAATAAGAAIGSVVPGLGTAAGAAVGRIAGTTASLARKAMPFLASAVVSGKATEEEIINNARDTIMALDVNNKDDLKTLQAMPGWNELLARSDNNPELAKLRMSAFASEDAAFAGAITGAIAGLVGPEAFLAKGATKLIVRSNLSKPATVAATVGKTAGAAALSSASEGAEEAMTQYLSNYASIYGSDDRRGLTSHLKATWGEAPLMEGVANAAAQGIGVGLIAGGAGGAMGFRSDLADTEKAISQQRVKNEVNFIKHGVETLTNEVDTLLASGKVDQKALNEALLSGFRTQTKELSATANKYSYRDEQQGKQMVYDHIIEPVLERSGVTTEQAAEVVRKINTAFPEVNTNPYAQAAETPFIKALKADTLEQAEAIYGKPLSTLRADTWRVYNNKDTGSVTNLDQAQAAASLVRSVLDGGDALTVQRAGAVLRNMYGYRNADNKLVDGIIHKHPNLSDSQLDAILELAKTELDAYNRRETNEERQAREQGEQTGQQPNNGGVSRDGGNGSVAVGTPSQGQDQANQETNLGDLGGQEQGGQTTTATQGGGSGRSRQTAQSADASDVTAETSGSVAGTTETPPVVQDPNSTPTPRQPSATPTSDGGNGQANQAPEYTRPANTAAESTPDGSGVTGAKTAERSTDGERTTATASMNLDDVQNTLSKLSDEEYNTLKQFTYALYKRNGFANSINDISPLRIAYSFISINIVPPPYQVARVEQIYREAGTLAHFTDTELKDYASTTVDVYNKVLDLATRDANSSDKKDTPAPETKPKGKGGSSKKKATSTDAEPKSKTKSKLTSTTATTEANLEQLKAAIQRLPKDDLVAVKEFAYLSFKESANLRNKNATTLGHMTTAMMNISMTDAAYRYDSVLSVYLSDAAKRYQYSADEAEALASDILDIHARLMVSAANDADGKKSYLGDKKAKPVTEPTAEVGTDPATPETTAAKKPKGKLTSSKSKPKTEPKRGTDNDEETSTGEQTATPRTDDEASESGLRTDAKSSDEQSGTVREQGTSDDGKNQIAKSTDADVRQEAEVGKKLNSKKSTSKKDTPKETTADRATDKAEPKKGQIAANIESVYKVIDNVKLDATSNTVLNILVKRDKKASNPNTKREIMTDLAVAGATNDTTVFEKYTKQYVVDGERIPKKTKLERIKALADTLWDSVKSLVAAVSISLAALTGTAMVVPVDAQASTTYTQTDLSQQVKDTASHVVQTKDNGGKPFIVADKMSGNITLFDANGKVLTTAPALYGSEVGDTLQGTNRQTPAGRFTLTYSKDDKSLGDMQVLDGVSMQDGNTNYVWAIHRVINPKGENRLNRLNSKTASDNRISNGCINVPAEFFNKHLNQQFDGVLYVLPETANFNGTMFNNTTVSDRASTTEQSGRSEGSTRAANTDMPNTTTATNTTPTAEQVGNIGKHPLLTADEITAANNRILGLPDEAPTPADEPARVGDNPSTQQAVIEAVTIDGKSYTTALVEQGQLTPAEERADTTFDTLPTTEKSSDGFSVSDIAIALGSLVGLGAGIVRLRRVRRNGKVEVEPVLDDTEATADTETVTETPTESKSTTGKLKSLVSRKKQPKSNRRVVENDQDLVSQIRSELLSLENLQDNIAAQQLLYAMAGNPSALAVGYAANWNPIMRSINAALQDDTNAFKANSKTFSWRVDRKGTDDESKANGPISSLYNRYMQFSGGATPNFDRFLELTGGKRIGLMQDSFKLSAALAKINATRNALFGTFNTRVLKGIEKTMLDHEFNPEYAKRIKALGKKPSKGDIGYSIPHDFGMYATYMHAYYEAYDWQVKSMTNVAKHHETEAEYARDKALEVVRKYVDDDQVIKAIANLIESDRTDGEIEATLRSYDISHNDLSRVKRFKRDYHESMTKADRQYELIDATQEYYENAKGVTGKTDYPLPIGMTKQDIEAKMKALEDLYGKDALEKTAKSIFRANELAVQEAVMRGGYTSQELATIKAAGFKMYVPLHKAKSETDATVGDVLEAGYFDVYEEASREYRTMGLTPDLVRYHRKGMTSPPNDAYTNLLPFVQNQMGRAAESDFKHGIRELAEGTNPTIASLSSWKKDGVIEYTDTEGLIRIPASMRSDVLPEYLRNHVGVRMRGTTVIEVPHETERGKFVKKLVESDYIYYFTDIKVQNELTHVAQSNDKLRRSVITNNLYTIQRWQAALMTSKRPVWNFWNFFKEASERTITLMFRPVADADGNRISSRKLAATNIKNLAKISSSMELQAEITDYIRYREVTTPLQRILAEMDDAGALQLYTSTVDRHNDMQDEFKSELDKLVESVGKNAKKLASKYKVSNRALSNTESLADWYQTRLVETPQVVNALATYMTYKQLGVNKKEATNRTRDMFDPLRLNAPVINKLASFFPFVRSTLAGNYNTARTVDMITQDPKMAAIAVLGVMSSAALLALALSALGDDDETGEPYAERLKFDDLSRGLPIRVGKDVFFIPVGFGAPNILWSMGSGIALGTMNEVEPTEIVSNTLVMALKNTVPFAPASGDENRNLAGVLLSFAPAMVRPVAEIMFNQRAFGGSAIVTARNVPEGYDKADVSAWGTPEAYKSMAKTLAGVGLDMHPEQLRHLIQSYALQGPLRAIDAALQDKGEKSGDVLMDKGEALGPLMTALGADINYQTNRFSYRNAFYELQEKEKEILKKYGVTATRSGADTLEEVTPFAGLEGLDSSRIKQEDSNIARVRNELSKKGATLDEVQFIIDMNYAKLDYRNATSEAGKAATHYYRSVKSGEASDKTAPSIFQEQFLMAELEMNQFVKKYLRLLSED